MKFHITWLPATGSMKHHPLSLFPSIPILILIIHLVTYCSSTTAVPIPTIHNDVEKLFSLYGDHSIHESRMLATWKEDPTKAPGKMIARENIAPGQVILSLSLPQDTRESQILTEDLVLSIFGQLLQNHTDFNTQKIQHHVENVELIHQMAVVLVWMRHCCGFSSQDSDCLEISPFFQAYACYLRHSEAPKWALEIATMQRPDVPSLSPLHQRSTLRMDLFHRWTAAAEEYNKNLSTFFPWITLENWIWAMHAAWSRLHVIYDERIHDKVAALVPLGDFFNYAPHGEETVYSVTSHENTLDFIAKRNISKGEELTVTYSRHVTNRKLLLEYGFCVAPQVNDTPGMKHEEVILDLSPLLTSHLKTREKVQQLQGLGLFGIPTRMSIRSATTLKDVNDRWLELSRIILLDGPAETHSRVEVRRDLQFLDRFVEWVDGHWIGDDDHDEAGGASNKCLIFMRKLENQLLRNFSMSIKRLLVDAMDTTESGGESRTHPRDEL